MARKPKAETPSSRIALLREERGWSQTELAAKMYVPQRTISDIERGLGKTLSNYLQLAEIFNVSLDYLVERTDTTNFYDEADQRIIDLLRHFSPEQKERIIRHLEIEVQ